MNTKKINKAVNNDIHGQNFYLDEVVDRGSGFAFYALMVLVWGALYGALFLLFLIV